MAHSVYTYSLPQRLLQRPPDPVAESSGAGGRHTLTGHLHPQRQPGRESQAGGGHRRRAAGCPRLVRGASAGLCAARVSAECPAVWPGDPGPTPVPAQRDRLREDLALLAAPVDGVGASDRSPDGAGPRVTGADGPAARPVWHQKL